MSFTHEEILWIVFAGLVGFMLWLDFWVLQRKPHAVGMREAVFWSIFWFVLALAFGGLVFALDGPTSGAEYITAYLIERSLSIDNLFVFMLVFNFFRIPIQFQQRSLNLGIMGALVMRAIFLGTGIVLLQLFHPIIYVFGALLIYSAYKMIRQKDEEVDPNKNPAVKLVRRIMPVTDNLEADHFFIKDDIGRRVATPLLLVLVAIGVFDLVFAIDSIPAVLAVSPRPFIVYTSNIFAVLGLRPMYFALAGLVGMFRYLSSGLAIVLAFIGMKLLLSDVFEFPIVYALGIVLGILALSVVVSIAIPQKTEDGDAHAGGAKPPAPHGG